MKPYDLTELPADRLNRLIHWRPDLKKQIEEEWARRNMLTRMEFGFREPPPK